MESLATIGPLKLAAETVESVNVAAPMVAFIGMDTMPWAGSLHVIEIAPDGVPPDVGMSRTATVSCPPGAMAKVLVMELTLKLDARLLMLVTFRTAVPVLRKVSRRLTAVLAGTTPKSIDAGATITGAVPGWFVTVRNS